MHKATWWLQEGKAGNYVRCELPARYLPGKCTHLGLNSAVLDGEFEDGTPRVKIAEQEGAAIWCFPGNATRGVLMRSQQLNGVKTIVEVDDNYIIPAPHKTEWKRTIAESGTEDYHSREAHVRIVQSVTDAVIVSTPYLEKRYRSIFDGPIHVCRNTVDPADWNVTKHDDGILRFGWSASASHKPDAVLLDRAIRWLCKQDGVQVCLVGQAFTQWRDLPIDWVTWTNDLDEYRQLIAKFDVGFCPVVRNDWSAARSDLKALEYSMAGVMSIVSANEPYDLWQADMPCLTAKNEREFFQAARWCVQHRDEIKTIAAQAKDYVLSNRTAAANSWRWQEAIT